MQKSSINVYLEAAMIAVVAVVVSFFPIQGVGFDIALGSIPMTLIALRRGTKVGLFSGLLWGVLTIILGGASILHPVQVFLDYPVAFLFNGFAGLVAPAFQQAHLLEQRRAISGIILLASIIGDNSRPKDGPFAFIHSSLTAGRSLSQLSSQDLSCYCSTVNRSNYSR